eukprot:scaffold1386_cov342-Pavlova_lutheri.AAC.1
MAGRAIATSISHGKGRDMKVEGTPMRDGKDRATPVEASSKEHVVGPWDGRTGMVVARRSTVAYPCLALQPSRCPYSTPRTRHAALFSRRRLCASMEKTGLVVHATIVTPGRPGSPMKPCP